MSIQEASTPVRGERRLKIPASEWHAMPRDLQESRALHLLAQAQPQGYIAWH